MLPDIAPAIGDDRAASSSAPALTTAVVKSAFESDTLARITLAIVQSALATACGLASAPTAPPAGSAQPMLGAKEYVSALTTPDVKRAFASDTLARIAPATVQSAFATARGYASALTAPPAILAQPMLGAKEPVVRLFHVSDRACRNRPDPEGGPRREDTYM